MMETDSLTYATLKNLSYSLLGYGWPLIFALFVTPIIVLNLGTRDYGVYIFINTIASLLGLLDLGVSTATQKYLSEYSATESRRGLSSLIRSMNTLFLCIGSIGLLVMIGIGFIGCAHFNCIGDTSVPYSLLFLIAGGTFLVESLNSVFVFTPYALQRFDISTKVGAVKITLQQLTILLLVLGGYSLFSIFLSTFAYSLIFFFVNQIIARRILPEARLRFGIHFEEIRKVYAFGFSIMLNNLSTSTLAHLDRFLIPIFLGPSQLTYYSLPGTISSKIPGVTGSMSSVIFPVTTKVHNGGDHAQLVRVYQRSLRLVTILAASMAISLFIFSTYLLRYWLNEDFVRKSGHVLMIFAAIAFLVSIQTHVSNFLYGTGKLKAITNTSIVMALVNLLLLLVLLPSFGITGAAWAYVLSLLPVFYLLYIVEARYLSIPHFFKRYALLYSKLIATGVLLYIFAHFALIPLSKSFAALLVIGPLSVLSYLFIFWRLRFFDTEDLREVRAYMFLVGRRMKIWNR